MKRAVKKLIAVILYLLFLCFLLKTKVILLFSPGHIGMFLLGCMILCIPYLERGTKWKEFGGIFKKNAIIAGYLETFMLIFVSMVGKEVLWEELPAELALDLRPLFYGFVCYMILKDETDVQKEDKKLEQIKEGEKRESGNETEHERKVERNFQPYVFGPIPTWEKPKRERHGYKNEIDLSKLTRQEKVIAEMIRQGLRNREIGEELCISETTVKKHVSNIFAKLEISSRKELK